MKVFNRKLPFFVAYSNFLELLTMLEILPYHALKYFLTMLEILPYHADVVNFQLVKVYLLMFPVTYIAIALPW